MGGFDWQVKERTRELKTLVMKGVTVVKKTWTKVKNIKR